MRQTENCDTLVKRSKCDFFLFKQKATFFFHYNVIIQSTVVDVVILFSSFSLLFPIFWGQKKRFKEKLKNLIWTHTEAPHSNNNGTKSAPPPFNIQNILLSKMVWPPTLPPPFPLSKCLPRLNVSRGDIIEKKERKKNNRCRTNIL